MSTRRAFLLGSGISRASGVPMVGQITERIFNVTWQADTSEGFHPLQFTNPFGNDLGDKPQEMIRRLHGKISDDIELRAERAPHYEDYYSCLWQIVQNETFEVLNPLIEDFVTDFKAECADLVTGYPSHISHATGTGIIQNPFASLADRASLLVEWVVYHALSGPHHPTGLTFLSEAIRQHGITDIFSLNHDILLEQFLKDEGLDYSDGFGSKDGDAQLFDRSWRDGAIRLFKLHGSINWHRLWFRSRDVIQYGRFIANRSCPRDAMGTPIGEVTRIPRFLTGTIGKELAYGNGIFADIFREFRTRLERCETLICSGYGWSDKGINVRINDWLLENQNNRIVILHGKEGEPLEAKRFWHNRWDKYASSGRLVIIPKWLSECEAADIADC